MAKRRKPLAADRRPRLPETAPSISKPRSLRDIGAAALLFGSVLLAYLPALHGGLIIDDAGHITSARMQSLHGLWRIWFELGATTQYYPVLHSAFWIEHRLWGDAVLGYHLTNALLHAAAALLVVALVRRLSLPGAWLAGFLFALHPVCVETVAWISEQKNTLSAVFYLGAALLYLDFDRTRRKSRYGLALGLFALALMSKSVTATLPVALLVILWWRRGRLEWKRDWLPLLPWLALGASGGLFTAWVERRYIGAEGADFALTAVERCLVAGRALWFYAWKMVLPANLTFIYPRWRVDAAAWWQYLFPLAALAAAAGLWLAARRRRGPLAAFLFFAVTLLPALGFLNVYPFLYSFVADHYQYLASLGIIVPAAYGLAMASRRRPGAARALGVLLVLALGVLTWRQSAMYRDAETLYRETLARNPECWMAQNNLGKLLMQVPGRLPEAIGYLEASLRIEPNRAMTHYNLGTALAMAPGRLPDAMSEFQTALRLDPEFAEAHDGMGKALMAAGRPAEGLAEFEAAVRLAPGDPRIHNNLGTALARAGRAREAMSEFRAALQIDPDLALAHVNLGNELSSAGQLPEALAEYEEALRIDPSEAVLRRVERLRAAMQR
jgi:tetratricopeptide (TPR) repeat protein